MTRGNVCSDVPDSGVELLIMHLLFPHKEVETKTSLELQIFISLFYTKYSNLHNSQSTDEQWASRRHSGVLSDEKQSCREWVPSPIGLWFLCLSSYVYMYPLNWLSCLLSLPIATKRAGYVIQDLLLPEC